jgi:hypothetical protein
MLQSELLPGGYEFSLGTSPADAECSLGAKVNRLPVRCHRQRTILPELFSPALSRSSRVCSRLISLREESAQVLLRVT